MKILKYIFIGLLLIQLIRPSKNIHRETQQVPAVSDALEAPQEIQQLLKNSCYDCHSDNTRYLWYHEIAPFSWAVAYHIKKGKEHVNFDAWNKYNKDQLKHIKKNLNEVLKSREMPLFGYLKFHPEAVLSDADNKKLLDWAENLP